MMLEIVKGIRTPSPLFPKSPNVINFTSIVMFEFNEPTPCPYIWASLMPPYLQTFNNRTKNDLCRSAKAFWMLDF